LSEYENCGNFTTDLQSDKERNAAPRPSWETFLPKPQTSFASGHLNLGHITDNNKWSPTIQLRAIVRPRNHFSTTQQNRNCGMTSNIYISNSAIAETALQGRGIEAT